MSPAIFCCVLCGYIIYGSQAQESNSWLGEFLIGTGKPKANVLDWTAPLDSDCDWRKAEDRSQQGQTIPVMTQYPENQVHGYVLHAACWSLLEKFAAPRAVPLDRLLQLCKSLPFPLRYDGVSWDHAYGGLVFYDDENNYPWEDRFKPHESNGQLTIDAVAKSDPINIPSPPSLLRRQGRDQDPPVGSSHWTADCFGHFPLEIRETMAIYLSTEDALTLRIASRSFLPIFYSSKFWASRFCAVADRGFLFEARERTGPLDWRALWRATANPRCCGIRNRRRIWSIIQMVWGLLDMSLRQMQHHPQRSAFTLSNSAVSVAADMRDRFAAFHEGCSVQGYQCITIPPELSQLAVTLVDAGGISYISGIRLLAVTTSDVCLGYIAKEKEVIFQVSRIGGFELAMGSRGLHALRITYTDQSRSPWLGDPIGIPITQRLTGFESLDLLEAGFDVGFHALSPSFCVSNELTKT